jgi:hypothetical protein
MFKTTATYEVTNGLVLDGDAVPVLRTPAQAEANRQAGNIAPRHLDMKWIITGRGLDACWAVRADEPAYFGPTEMAPVAPAARRR